MLDVWAVWPTVRPGVSDALALEWKVRGYQVAVLVEQPHRQADIPNADVVIVQEKWDGFPRAANALCRAVPGDVVVVAGDDIHPHDGMTAQEISRGFATSFPDLMGVMQPTGDRYGGWDICAISPWIGRRFIRDAYDGHGPYCTAYFHYFSDTELQAYATQLGCFEQRPEITQYHDHWSRNGKGQPAYIDKAMAGYGRDREIFERRRRSGFPSID